jgi:MscS family membrane protein
MVVLTEEEVTQATTTVFLVVVGRALTVAGLKVLQSSRFDRWLQTDFTEERDRAMMKALLEKLFVIVIAFLTLGSIMIAWGVSATAVGTVLGGAGIGIGFGTQQISQNFLSGLMLFFNRPFTEGDWINVSSFQGVVERIGWYHTRIRTFERRPLYIPNSLFATTPIENPGRMYNRRINAEIGLRYEDIGRMPRVIHDVRSMLEAHVGIDHDQSIVVNFNQWDSSSVNMLVNCFTRTTDGLEWLEIQQDVFFKIADVVSAAGADFAFPSTTLYPAPSASDAESTQDGPDQLMRRASSSS